MERLLLLPSCNRSTLLFCIGISHLKGKRENEMRFLFYQSQKNRIWEMSDCDKGRNGKNGYGKSNRVPTFCRKKCSRFKAFLVIALVAFSYRFCFQHFYTSWQFPLHIRKINAYAAKYAYFTNNNNSTSTCVLCLPSIDEMKLAEICFLTFSSMHLDLLCCLKMFIFYL